MSKNKLIGFFYFIVGIGIISLWIMLFCTNQIPEIETEPISIAFHIFIEISMGIMSIITGYLILRKSNNAHIMLLFTSGMIAYSVVNSSGYYGDSGDYAMIVMFGILLVGVISSVLIFVKKV